MSSLAENVNTCVETRNLIDGLTTQILAKSQGNSEVQVGDALQHMLASRPELCPKGWYEPPPSGIAVLFAEEDRPERSRFLSLRHEEYWPRTDLKLDQKTIGMVYVSSIHKISGVIADLNFSFYRGDRPEIRNHFKHCLETIELAAEHATVGMSFQQLHEFTQALLKKQGLNNSWTHTVNDPTGSDIGHTIPWTHEEPTKAEKVVIDAGDHEALKNLISSKRLFVNGSEKFKIPPTIAFTFEIQFTSNDRPELPNVYFHFIVTFIEGKKRVIGNFNATFKTFGMDYIRSRF